MDKRHRDSHLILKLIYFGAVIGLAIGLLMLPGCARQKPVYCVDRHALEDC
jgi:hypothetical protein